MLTVADYDRADYDRFDICEAYLLLEWDYNVGGWLRERPTNRRRMEATAVQLARMGFTPSANLSFDSLCDNAKTIYLGKALEWKLALDATQQSLLEELFEYAYLARHRPDIWPPQ